VRTQDLVSSIVNGYGFFCFANVVAHYVGLTSPASVGRIGGLVESSGFKRVIFPFSENLNESPIMAAIVCLAFFLSFGESTRKSNNFKYIWLFSSAVVMFKSGNRTAIILLLLVLILLAISNKLFYLFSISAVPFAVFSSSILPLITSLIAKIVVPISSFLTFRRDPLNSNSFTYQGRSIIWERSIEFWQQWVNSLFHQLLGYGPNGQYVSGASQTYSQLLKTISLNTEYLTVHNSFLQQLFNGGLVGVVLLGSAYFLALRRLKKEFSLTTFTGSFTNSAFVMLLIFGTQESMLAASFSGQPFWFTTFLIGIACTTTSNPGHSSKRHQVDVI
jgi:O-antigen ligase